MEDWAEIRRLYRSEGLSKAAVARRLGVARSTVAAALARDRPPKYERRPAGSIVDAVEPQIRALLAELPTMPATVIAERVGWTRSLTVLKDRVRVLRPLFVPPDPADRSEYDPGEVAQCDLWFPPCPVPVGGGVGRVPPVLAMVCGCSRVTGAVMIPWRKAGDVLAGMWQVVARWGACPRTLVRDREAAIGGRGRPGAEAAASAGTLGVRLRLAPPRDPESEGLVERVDGYLETSFLPGRVFTSPDGFNAQPGAWLDQRASTRHLRATGTTPAARWDADRAAMTALPPVPPRAGLAGRVRLARGCCVRVDANDCSVDPRFVGRFVDWTASPTRVEATCGGRAAATHERLRAAGATVTDPAHRATARTLRADLAARRGQAATRAHPDGRVVAVRALPGYDALFGVDLDPAPHHGAPTAGGG